MFSLRPSLLLCERGFPDVHHKELCTFQRVAFFSLSLSVCSNKINLCCWVGTPVSMTTQWSVSAILVPLIKHTNSSPESPYLCELFSFLLSLHLLLPGYMCLQAFVVFMQSWVTLNLGLSCFCVFDCVQLTLSYVIM